MDSISRAASDISSAAEQGETLSALGREASATLNSTIPKCKEAVQTYLYQFQQHLESYRELVDGYNADMAGIPEKFSGMHSTLDNVLEFGMYSLAAPVALVILCCFAIVVVVRTACSTSGNGRRSRCCVHSLGLVLFAPAILVVGAATTAEFDFGLATSSFCKDADTNALTYIEYYADGLTYNVSRYYISAVGTNPLLDQLRAANETIVNLETAVDQLGSLVATDCTDAGPAMEIISATLKSVHAPLNKADDLLSPVNLYPLYKTAIHEAACTTTVSGVSWLVLVQFVVGSVCLPKFTCMADRFLDGWVSYRANQANRATPAACALIVSAGTQLREGTV